LGAAVGTSISAAIADTRRGAAVRESFRTTTTGTCVGTTIRAAIGVDDRTAISATIGTARCRSTVGRTFPVTGRGRHVVVVQAHDAAPFERCFGDTPVRKVDRG
jgi:hypothetical protein